MYGWAVGQFITVVSSVGGKTFRSVGADAFTSRYYFPASTLTSLELAREGYATAFTTSTLNALQALTLGKVNPWSRFLAGLDPVPSTQTPAVAPTSVASLATTKSEQADSRELGAVDELRDWLGLTYEQIASATSIGLRTVHHWKQAGATPRPRTVRTLWRLHTLVHSIRRALGAADAIRWLRSGSPSYIDLIVAGDLAAVEDQARRLLFAAPIGERRFSAVRTEEEPPPRFVQRERRPNRATRRAKIVRRETDL
jgi:hypothetical protein